MLLKVQNKGNLQLQLGDLGNKITFLKTFYHLTFKIKIPRDQTVIIIRFCILIRERS